MDAYPFSAVGLEPRGLRDRVYDLILEMLTSGEVQPGTRLSIDSIARQLGVSQTPVREALVQLERTGLVTREALKGYRVAPPLGSAQISELFDARMVLEVGAVDLALNDVDGLVPDLRAAEARHEEVAQRVREARADGVVPLPLFREYFEADWGFHRAILERSGNRFLQEMADSVGTHLHRMRQSVMHGLTDVDEAVAEHNAIVAAFASDDPMTARAAMRRHIENVRARAIHDA